MLKKSYSIKFFNLNKMTIKHRKRRRKQRKRHAETFFNSRRQRFEYYYYKFSRLIVLKQKNLNYSINKTQPVKKYLTGIRSVEMDFITIYPLRSVIKLTKRFLRNNYIEGFTKTRFSIFTDFWLTAKAKAVRMGKGKGSKKRKIYFLKKGEIMYELRYRHKNTIFFKNKKLLKFMINLYSRSLLIRLQHKFPVKNKIFKKFL